MNGILIISSKIGTPIWSREYVHSFGLRNEETHQIKAKDVPLMIKDGGEGVVGDITSLVATKTHHISDMSLSGLLYALKLNGEMCFIQDALNSSNIENELINFEILKSFEFGNCLLSFYESFDDNVYCVAIFDTIMLETSNFAPDYLNIGSEDQLNGTQFCNSITKNICDKFCDLFRKDIQNTSVRKAFKAFKPHLNVIYRDVILSIGKQLIYDCTCCDAKVGWLHIFNIKNCPNIFTPIEVQIVEQKPTKKNSKR